MLCFKINLALAVQLSGSDYKLLNIKNKPNSTEIYIRNNQNQEILLYKSNFVYSENAVIGADREANPDVVSVMFDCDQKYPLFFCTRFVNLRNNQLSDIYPSLLDYNVKKNIVAYYIPSENRLVFTPLFEECKYPLTYKIKIRPDSIFGSGTQFLPNGSLEIDYAEPIHGNDATKIIPIDYQQLYKNCGLKTSQPQISIVTD